MTIQLTIYIVKWLYNWLCINDYIIDYIHSQMAIQSTMLLLLLLLLNFYIYKAAAAEFQQFTAAAAADAAAEYLYL